MGGPAPSLGRLGGGQETGARRSASLATGRISGLPGGQPVAGGLSRGGLPVAGGITGPGPTPADVDRALGRMDVERAPIAGYTPGVLSPTDDPFTDAMSRYAATRPRSPAVAGPAFSGYDPTPEAAQRVALEAPVSGPMTAYPGITFNNVPRTPKDQERAYADDDRPALRDPAYSAPATPTYAGPAMAQHGLVPRQGLPEAPMTQLSAYDPNAPMPSNTRSRSPYVSTVPAPGPEIGLQARPARGLTSGQRQALAEEMAQEVPGQPALPSRPSVPIAQMARDPAAAARRGLATGVPEPGTALTGDLLPGTYAENYDPLSSIAAARPPSRKQIADRIAPETQIAGPRSITDPGMLQTMRDVLNQPVPTAPFGPPAPEPEQPRAPTEIAEVPQPRAPISAAPEVPGMPQDLAQGRPPPGMPPELVQGLTQAEIDAGWRIRQFTVGKLPGQRKGDRYNAMDEDEASWTMRAAGLMPGVGTAVSVGGRLIGGIKDAFVGSPYGYAGYPTASGSDHPEAFAGGAQGYSNQRDRRSRQRQQMAQALSQPQSTGNLDYSLTSF